MENASLSPGINAALLDSKLAELEKVRNWSPRLVSKLEALLHEADSWKLFRVNPIKLAAERGLDEQETIDLFLHATHIGLFNMEWHLICPSCGDAVESFSSLAGVHSHFACKMCHLNDMEAQLDNQIEISFSVSAQLRDCPFHHPESLPVEDYYFKYRFNNGAAVPGMNMSFAQLMKMINKALSYLEPQEAKAFEFSMDAGFMMGYDLIRDHGFFYTVSGEPTQETQALSLRLTENGFEPAEGALRPGKLHLQVKSELGARASVMAGQLPTNYFETKINVEIPVFLNGNRLLSSQTFRNLFRSETIKGSEGIGIRELTLLFTDLKGSTEMYERIGDLKAFSLVQQHFEHLTRAIQSHRGAVVKTIGDAVMASFEKPADAVAAALLMLDEIETFNRQQGANEIILKIGIHQGASIAVTLNERLDFFGQSVNIAARVQGLADAEEICVTKSVYEAKGVKEQLEHFQVSPEQAALKGIQRKMPIWRVRQQAPKKPKLKVPKKLKPKPRPKAAGPERKSKAKSRAKTKRPK